MPRKGLCCARCFFTGESPIAERPTRHHVLPKRHFHGRGGTIVLCEKCHGETERVISAIERRLGNPADKGYYRLPSEKIYLALTKFFLVGFALDEIIKFVEEAIGKTHTLSVRDRINHRKALQKAVEKRI